MFGSGESQNVHTTLYDSLLLVEEPGTGILLTADLVCFWYR